MKVAMVLVFVCVGAAVAVASDQEANRPRRAERLMAITGGLDRSGFRGEPEPAEWVVEIRP